MPTIGIIWCAVGALEVGIGMACHLRTRLVAGHHENTLDVSRPVVRRAPTFTNEDFSAVRDSFEEFENCTYSPYHTFLQAARPPRGQPRRRAEGTRPCLTTRAHEATHRVCLSILHLPHPGESTAAFLLLPDLNPTFNVPPERTGNKARHPGLLFP